MNEDSKVRINNYDNYFFDQPKSYQFSPVENSYLKDINALLFMIPSTNKNKNQNINSNSNSNYNNNNNSNTNIFKKENNENIHSNLFEKNRFTQFFNHHCTKIRHLINCSKQELMIASNKNENEMNLLNGVCYPNSIKEIAIPIKMGSSKIKFFKKKTYTMSLVDKLSENFNKYIKLNPINRNYDHLNIITQQKNNQKGLTNKEERFKLDKSIKMNKSKLEAIGKKKNLCLNKYILQLDKLQNNLVKNIKKNQRSFVIHFNKKGKILNTSNISQNYSSEEPKLIKNMSYLNSANQFSIVFKRLKYKKDVKL